MGVPAKIFAEMLRTLLETQIIEGGPKGAKHKHKEKEKADKKQEKSGHEGGEGAAKEEGGKVKSEKK